MGLERKTSLELLPGVHLLRGVWGCNVYYLADPENPALIDAGLPARGRRLGEALRRLAPALPPPRWVLATHYHIDHAGGTGWLQRDCGATVVVHRAEADFFVRRPGVNRAGSPFLSFGARTEPDLLLEGGETLPVLGGLEVHHTPGHTPGSLCFFLRGSGALFTGDLFVSYGDRFSRTFMGPGSDRQAYLASIQRMAVLGAPILLPGHGFPVFRDAPARLADLAARGGRPAGALAWLRSVPRLAHSSLGIWKETDLPGLR